jgi:PAS domain S-box-containing protein
MTEPKKALNDIGKALRLLKREKKIKFFNQVENFKDFLVVDSNGKILHLNEMASRKFGYVNKELLINNSIDSFLPDIFKNIKDKTIQCQKIKNTIAISKEKNPFIVKVKVDQMYCLGIRFYIVFLVNENFSKEIDLAADFFEYFVTNNDDAILFKFDRDLKIDWISSNCERVIGFTKEEIVGKNGFDFFASNISENFYQSVHAHQKLSSKVTSFNGLCIKKNGKNIWMKFLIAKEASASKKDAFKGLCLATNIETTKHFDDIANDSSKSILDASQLETNSSNSINFWQDEFKSSLESISENLHQAINNKNDGEKVNNAHSLCNYLKDLVSDFSNINSYKKEVLTFSEFNLPELIQKITHQKFIENNSKDILIEKHFDKNIPITISTDREVLEKILKHLLINAINNSTIGSKISINLEKVDDNLVVALKDQRQSLPSNAFNGFFGISNKDKEISESQSSASFVIAKAAVRSLSGKLEVLPLKDFNLAYRVTIPVKKVKLNTFVLPKKNTYKQEDGYILIAEDEGTNQMILMAYLSNLGYHNFELLDNGKDSLDRLLGRAISSIPYLEKRKPLIFLCDYKMVQMNGEEVIKRYIEFCKEHDKKSVPIIALTADSSKETQEKLFVAGADDIMIKPITIDNLKKILVKYIGTPN